MKKKISFMDRISPFTLVLTLVILMIIGAALIPFIDVSSSPRPRQGKTLSINYHWTNASPKVIEQEITSKIEGTVAAVKGVESVNSESYFGYGRVQVVLKKETDISATKFEISSLLKQISKSFPKGCSYPELSGGEVVNEKSMKATSVNLLIYSINTNLTDDRIQEYIRKNVEPAILDIEDVKGISISGGTSQYLEIKYDPLILSNYEINVSDMAEGIKNFIGKSNIVGDVLHTNDNNERSRITLQLSTLPFSRDIGEIPLKTINEKIIYLNDLATYTYKDRLPGSYYRVNGLNTIYMNVYVDADGNLLSLSDKLRQRIEDLKPHLKDGVYLELTYDGAKEKKSELEKLITRTLAALFILLGFVWIIRRSGKYLSIIAITLAANILISVIAYYLFNIRLHTIALAGITVSLGLIIDASIVMVDHYSYYHNRKAFLAILAALLTTIGALVLVFLMPEYIQNDLHDFSWIIIINLTIAMLVALLFVPALVKQMNYSSKKQFIPIKRSKRIVAWTHFYKKYILFTQKRKWIYYFLVILAFGIPFHALPDKWDSEEVYYLNQEEVNLPWYKTVYNNTLGSRFFQSDLKEPLSKIFGGAMRLFAESLKGNTYSQEEKEMKLNIRAQMPLGGTAQELNEKVQILENFLSDFQEIKRFETRVENWGASVVVEFKKEFKNTSFPYILESKVIGKILNIGGADWSTSGVSERGFSNSLNLQSRSNRIEIAGYNYNKLYRYAEEMCAKLKTNNRVMDVTIETPEHEDQEDELYMVYNKENIALYQLDVNATYAALSGLLSETELGRYADKNIQTDLRLKSIQTDSFDLWNMENSYIRTGEQLVFIPNFMQINKREAKNCIPKKNQEYVLRVAFNVLGSYIYTENYLEEMTQYFNASFPVGYRCLNSSANWYKDDGTQYWLILVIVIIIFFMCSILFESLRLPLVIITLIPVSFIGTFLTFYFSEVNFGTGGFASLILLCGIVVNAGIYVINEYNLILRDTTHQLSAVQIYVKAYNHKIIPVFLTTLSTILGLIPFLIDGQEEAFWFSFAIGTIGGLLFSIPALIFIMPIFMPLKKYKKMNKRVIFMEQ